MKIKSSLTSSLIAAFSLGTAFSASEEIPKPLAFARYDAMTQRSPFAVATAVVAPPPAPNFAKDLYVANVAKLEKESVVTIVSSVDKNFKEYLSTAKVNEHGYSISNIELSDRVGATKVTIGKDGQFAPLTFNQALISQASANAPAPPPPQQPQPYVPPPGNSQIANQYNGVNNTIKPAPIPTLPTPPPRVRPMIPRNPERPVQQANTGVVPDEQ